MTEHSKIPPPDKNGKSLFERAEEVFGLGEFAPPMVPHDLAASPPSQAPRRTGLHRRLHQEVAAQDRVPPAHGQLRTRRQQRAQCRHRAFERCARVSRRLHRRRALDCTCRNHASPVAFLGASITLPLSVGGQRQAPSHLVMRCDRHASRVCLGLLPAPVHRQSACVAGAEP